MEIGHPNVAWGELVVDASVVPNLPHVRYTLAFTTNMRGQGLESEPGSGPRARAADISKNAFEPQTDRRSTCKTRDSSTASLEFVTEIMWVNNVAGPAKLRSGMPRPATSRLVMSTPTPRVYIPLELEGELDTDKEWEIEVRIQREGGYQGVIRRFCLDPELLLLRSFHGTPRSSSSRSTPSLLAPREEPAPR